MPLPEPAFTVSVYCRGGAAAYVAVTVAAEAGIVMVVDAAFASATFATSPVHASNTWPAGAAFATMSTTVPAA